MNYTKPQVAVLGKAVRVIEKFIKDYGVYPDGALPQSQWFTPAYDLDE
jgi:hypothetical protein